MPISWSFKKLLQLCHFFLIFQIFVEMEFFEFLRSCDHFLFSFSVSIFSCLSISFSDNVLGNSRLRKINFFSLFDCIKDNVDIHWNICCCISRVFECFCVFKALLVWRNCHGQSSWYNCCLIIKEPLLRHRTS